MAREASAGTRAPVLLDLDGTLTDRAAAFARWARGFVRDRGLPDRAVGWWVAEDRDGYRDRRELAALASGRWELPDDVDELAGRIRRGLVDEVRLDDAVRRRLRQLRSAGHPLAVVTNGAAEQQRAKVARLGLPELVDAVVVSAEVGVGKPDPAVFARTAAELGCELVGGWMVGDSAVHDIDGGRRVGLRTVWVSGRRPWPDDLTFRPDLVADSCADALATVLRDGV